MLQIRSYPISSQEDMEHLERDNHSGAFEYLPEAKERTYEDILNGEPGTSLTIKLIPSDMPDASENKLISNGSYLSLLSAARRALAEESCQILSLSYNRQNEENKKKESLTINCVINLTAKKVKEISMLPRMEKHMCNTLNILSTEDEPEYMTTESESDKKDGEILQSEPAEKTGSSVTGNSTDINDYGRKPSDDKLSMFYIPEESSGSEPGAGGIIGEQTNADIQNVGLVDPAADVQGTPVLFYDDLENTAEKTAWQEPAADDKETEGKRSDISDAVQQDILYQQSSKKQPFLNLIHSYIPKSNLENRELVLEMKDIDADIKTVASKQKIDKLFAATLGYCTSVERNSLARAQAGEIKETQFLKTVSMYMDKNLDLPMEDKKMFLDKVQRALFSYYKLVPLINNPEVTDIKVLSPALMNVKIGGIHYTVKGLEFVNDDDYVAFIHGLLRRNKTTSYGGISLFTDNQFCEDYILRFNITFPQLNVSGYPVLHIRKTEKKKLKVSELVERKVMPQVVADYVRDKIRTSRGIVFAGPSASGKTKMLNAFAEEIPYTDSVLCIQESDEIFADCHPNFMCQHILKRNDGTIVTGLDELGQNGLVCDIKYFIIGEIKGKEARDFLRACNTGHICMCTIHTPSAEDTISRFADYVKRGADYTMEEAERMLKDLEVIVYISEFKVREITEVLGYDDKEHKLIYRTVYLYSGDNNE